MYTVYTCLEKQNIAVTWLWKSFRIAHYTLQINNTAVAESLYLSHHKTDFLLNNRDTPCYVCVKHKKSKECPFFLKKKEEP